MALDQVSESRIKELYPPFAELVRKLSDVLEADGVIIRITQALRSAEEQNHLYAMGRTIESNSPCKHGGESKPRPIGTCNEHPLGAKVTNAKAGYGWHNYGLAVDVVPDDPDRPGFQPDWDNCALWKKIIAAGEALGLRSGQSWHDQPHFEFTGKFGPTPTDECRAVLAKDGVEGVWKLAFPETQAATA